jgi:hypothetical protein
LIVWILLHAVKRSEQPGDVGLTTICPFEVGGTFGMLTDMPSDWPDNARPRRKPVTAGYADELP